MLLQWQQVLAAGQTRPPASDSTHAGNHYHVCHANTITCSPPVPAHAAYARSNGTGVQSLYGPDAPHLSTSLPIEKLSPRQANLPHAAAHPRHHRSPMLRCMNQMQASLAAHAEMHCKGSLTGPSRCKGIAYTASGNTNLLPPCHDTAGINRNPSTVWMVQWICWIMHT